MTRRQSGEPLLQATWDGETESWRPTAPLQLTEGDRAYLKTFATQFYQQQPAQSRQLVRDPELEL